MKDAGNHVSLINNHLRHIKSTMRAEFIRPLTGCISIITNNVPSSSDLTVIEQYIKSIEGINTNEVSPPRLPQSKSYLKIIGIPYTKPDGNKLTSNDITDYIRHTDLFESISFSSKPRVIKASPKLDMAIVWLDIWDSQNGSKAKSLINHSVTNFIRSYLHQIFNDSHGLKASLKPLRRPFDRCQSRLEAINIGRDIKQINW